MLFFILGIVCILYYTAIILYAGPRSTFAPFWLTLGLGLSGLGAIWEQLPAFKGRQVAEVIFLGAAAVFFIVFWTVESRIIGAALHKAGNGAEVMIILGAQVQGQRPSKSLYRRVKTGARYLKLNPGTKVIVSGGQGPGEGISEAACMCRLLENLGIERQRIFLEDRSTDTYENIRNSIKICGTDQRTVIVTCGYHMYRSLALARTAGIRHVEGISAGSGRILCVNFYVREFFAVLHYRFSGRI